MGRMSLGACTANERFDTSYCMKIEEYERFEKMSRLDRRDIFNSVAEKRGIRSAYVEKDYWVCRALGVLMRQQPYKPKCFFKGGTSLSKGFALINRFSEDIDIASVAKITIGNSAQSG